MSTTTPPPRFQNLAIDFTSRSLSGKINVKLQPNLDPTHACGLDLIFPQITPASFPAQFFGFPVIKATISYPSLPPTSESEPNFDSYGSLFGWIQFVKSVDTSTGEGEWEMDIFPYAQDLNIPFAYWGYNPTLFDAPARLLGEDGTSGELDWRAQSFLCVLEDAGITRRVRVVEGAGFAWGFDIVRGDGKRKILMKELELLDVEKAWVERLGLLRGLYKDWIFLDADGK